MYLNNILYDMFTRKLPSEVLRKSNFQLFENKSLDSEADLEGVRPAKELLRELFGKKGECFSDKIGSHPDFENLTNNVENQYICSVFLDISGSTRLGLKFPLSTVRFYKNAILSTAIEIFQVFDGHIHRLQGDAVFAYFGHKSMKKSDAIINALNAVSVMQSYNKYTLSEFFEENGLEPLKIRIGMDIGDDSSVLWSSYGLENVTEITSTSIHTDLAAKLQGEASKNSIMLGENIYKYLDIPDEFIQIKTFMRDKKEEQKKYILSVSNLSAYYQMRIFDWEKYLSSFSFLPKETGLQYSSPNDFEINCEVSEVNQDSNLSYKSNSRSLSKGASITFKLELKAHLNFLKPTKIEWKVINRGKEAAAGENDIEFFMENQLNNYSCEQETAYTGHHYMQCNLYNSQGKLIGQENFGLYVNDEKNEMKSLGIQETEVPDV